VVYVIVALVVGGTVGGLPWAVVDVVGGSPAGAESVFLLIGGYVLAGFAAAVVYTSLNDGGDALLGLLHGRPRPRHRRSA
jgi:hypothetical protein